MGGRKSHPRSGDSVWCLACDYEAPIEDVPIGAITFLMCPKCQQELHILPDRATKEYRELLRRVRYEGELS